MKKIIALFMTSLILSACHRSNVTKPYNNYNLFSETVVIIAQCTVNNVSFPCNILVTKEENNALLNGTCPIEEPEACKVNKKEN